MNARAVSGHPSKWYFSGVMAVFSDFGPKGVRFPKKGAEEM